MAVASGVPPAAPPSREPATPRRRRRPASRRLPGLRLTVRADSGVHAGLGWLIRAPGRTSARSRVIGHRAEQPVPGGRADAPVKARTAAVLAGSQVKRLAGRAGEVPAMQHQLVQGHRTHHVRLASSGRLPRSSPPQPLGRARLQPARPPLREQGTPAGIEVSSGRPPRPDFPSLTSPRNGSSAGPSSAASSTNTSEPRRSPGQYRWRSSGTPQADLSG
jgi:hypothetical protein